MDVNYLGNLFEIPHNTIVDVSKCSKFYRYWLFLEFSAIYDISIEYLPFPKEKSKIKYNVVFTSYNLYTSTLWELNVLYKNKYIYVDALTKNLFLIDKVINSINNSYSIVIDYSLKNSRYLLLDEKKIQPFLTSFQNFFMFKNQVSISKNHLTLQDIRGLPYEHSLIYPFDSDRLVSQKILNKLYGTLFIFESSIPLDRVNLLLDKKEILLHKYVIYQDLKNLKNSQVEYFYYTSTGRMKFDCYFSTDFKV